MRIVLVALLLLSCTFETPTRPEVLQAASWQGPQRALWILIKQPGYSASVNPGAVESFIATNSFGAAQLEIDVAGWYSHPDPCGGSSTEFVALADPDVDFTRGYSFIVFGLIGSGCGGSIGGYGDYAPFQTDEGPVYIDKRATVRGSHVTQPEVWTHEMLHGEGLSESYRYTCGGFPAGFPYSCSGRSYGDTYTVMSAPQYGGTFGHLVAADKERLGWISPPTSGSGTTTLGRYETTGDVLKVRRNAQSFYYIERRDNMQLRVGRNLITDNLTSLSDPWSGVGFVVSGNQVTVTGVGGGDTTPPTGVIAYPAEGDTIRGIINVRVHTSEELYAVQWRESSNLWRRDVTDAPYSAEMDTRQFFDEFKIIRAKLIDPAGNTLDLSARVEISNATEPVIPELPAVSGVGIMERFLTYTAQPWDHDYAYMEIEIWDGAAWVRWTRAWMPPEAGRHSIKIPVPKRDVTLRVRPTDVNGDAADTWVSIRSFYDTEHIQ